ncbi:MAG: molybdopterin molybdotransferase MoeA [Clostridia bacterium]|nr:molybdopterin molybdotransferase MoeA [Clostridia bacterium]
MLHVVTKEEAIAIIREKTACLSAQTERLPLADAAGRILAADLIAGEDIPAFDRSTVDGYAVIAADTFGAGAAIPAQLDTVGEILMGEAAETALRRGQCVRISTGGMLPPGADAAVMVEQTEQAEGLCLVYKSVAPFENVTRKGDDLARGDAVLKKGTLLGAAQIGVLAALGAREVDVFRRPVIAIISTGDEITDGTPGPGQIRDINSYLLAAAAREAGCEARMYGVVHDRSAEIETAVRDCLRDADAVLLSGGSSAGARDLTVQIIDALGEVFFHGIAMKPGKPTIFGMIEGKPVFGLPGHPLAAYFVFRLIVADYLKACLRQPGDAPIHAGPLAVNIPSNHGRTEFLCVKIGSGGEVTPVHTKSGVISVLSASEGFIEIPRDAEGLAQGTIVKVYRL